MKKKCRLFILSLAMVCSLTACGGDGVSYNGSYATNDAAYTGGANIQGFGGSSGFKSDEYSSSYDIEEELTENKSIAEDRKLIRTISLEIKIPSSDLLGETSSALKGMAEQFNGYITRNDIDYGSSYAGGEIIAKIPKDSADSFLEQVESSGLRIMSVSDSLDDVTLEYSDVSTALEVQKIKREKYLEYLEQARDVNEILAIEDRLSDVVTQIEQHQSRLTLLNNQIDYTQISMSISCTTSKNRDSVGEMLKRRFGDIGRGFLDTLLDGLEWAAGAIATLVFTLPIILGVIFIVLKVVMKAVRRKDDKDNGTKANKEKKEKKVVKFFKERVLRERSSKDTKLEVVKEESEE